MNFVYQAKVVGLSFHKVENAVEHGDYVILVADPENEFDKDAIAVYNAERELVGHIANSDKTLSPNNRKNGNIGATELKGHLDFTNRQYYAEAVKVYRSCIYLEINEDKYSFINSTDNNPVVDESNGEDIVVLPFEAKNSTYTVVGIKYHSAKAHVGDIVRFKVVKGTTTLFNEDNESLGVLPQSDKKVQELQKIGAPVVLNQFARTDFHTLETAFVVAHIVKDKFIFLREMTEDDFKNDDESSFVSLRDLCQSSLSIELFIDFDGDFSIYFEDEGIGFEYKVVEFEGIKGVNL